MLLERLYPRPGKVEAEEAYTRLDLGSRAPAQRPYVVLNMVSTLDGKAVVEGSTRSMGGEADREIFHLLRTQADALLVGAGTVRQERYGRAVKSDELRERREADGLAPEPVTVIVSASGELPGDLPLLQTEGVPVVVATGSEREIGGVAADVTTMRVGDDLPVLLARLREEHGVRSVLCEGGPTLNMHLLAAGLVDELFLSVDPVLVGGEDALTIVAGRPLTRPANGELVALYEAGSALFFRWRLR